MFCPSCGKVLDSSVRFCSNCGAQVGPGFAAGINPGTVAGGAPYPTGKLVRPRYPRMIGGVCSAFALQYGWDVSLVRVITAVMAILTSGLGGLAYLAAWIIIPEAPYALPASAAGSTGSAGNTTV